MPVLIEPSCFDSITFWLYPRRPSVLSSEEAFINMCLKKCNMFEAGLVASILQRDDLKILINKLQYLVKRNILTQENLNRLLTHQNLILFTLGTGDINKGELLELDRTELQIHKTPSEKSHIFQSPQYKNEIESHHSPKLLSRAFRVLDETKMMNPVNQEAVLAHKSLFNVVTALELAKKHNILDQETFNLFMQKKLPEKLVRNFIDLKFADLLTLEYKKYLTDHADSSLLSSNFITLAEAGLLSSRIASEVFSHPEQLKLSIGISNLVSANLLDDCTLNIVLNDHHSDLVAKAMIALIDSRKSGYPTF